LNPITFWNRAAGREEVEQVYGDAFVRLLYGTAPGQAVAEHVLAGRWFSKIYGWAQSSSLSQRKIAPFIRRFNIAMEEYEDPGFRSFNDFFIRKFKPGRRPFAQEPGRMPAPCEARYLAWERIVPDQVFPVKGEHLSARALLQRDDVARDFEGGPLMIARLCPVDYHRFHYPDSGRTLDQYRLSGGFHSVNPLALKHDGAILCSNERHVSILETENFGKLAYLEVGAMCVGLIVQSHPWDRPFSRGDEKGYFLFGASTVVLMGQPGRWKPDADVLEQTRRDRETYVKIGAAIAAVA
jgi:phosphatidylserine decarboxylase